MAKLERDTRSLWEKTVSLPRRETLEGQIHTQVAILGAGMTGCLLGYRLARLGIDCVLLEAGTVGGGQTGHTTAKLTAQHGMLSKLVQKAGMERVRAYAAANQLALAEYAALAARLDADVGYRQCPAYLYARPGGADLRREAVLEAALGLPASFTRDTELPFPVQGAVRLDSQAVLHPLAFLRAITPGLKIYEHSQVTRVRGTRLWTAKGSVTAKQVVFACHYPFRNVPGFYFMKMHQARDYVLGLQDAGSLNGSYYGVDPGDLSLRAAEGLILAGGGGHRTGHNAEGGSYDTLARRTAAVFPAGRVVCRWSAQDCMTPDGIPYIGRYSALRPDWYVATGFNQWGMTNAMAASMLLADAICGRENGYAAAFAPGRWNAATVHGVLAQSAASAKNLGRQWLLRPHMEADSLKPGHGGVVMHQGRKVGAVKQDGGTLQTIRPKCPHMGCQLEWNPDEGTWECPCHGSRFDKDGHWLNGPARRNAEKD